MTVGVVVVSHSVCLADGVVELASQMAPDVSLQAAGGLPDGQIGTCLEVVNAAIDAADSGDGAVICYDLGSALMTAEMAVEFCPADRAARLMIVHAPVVQAAIAAAVCANGRASLAEVAAAAENSVCAPLHADQQTTVRIVNKLGLHARPAAQLARLAAGYHAQLTIARSDCRAVPLRSVLGVVAGAYRGGDDVQIAGHGTDAVDAVAAVVAAITAGFGEIEPQTQLHQAGPTDTSQPRDPVGASSLYHHSARVGLLHAHSASDGIAIGPVCRLSALPEQLDQVQAARTGNLSAAIAAAADRLAQRGEFGAAQAAIISDPDLLHALGPDADAGSWWNLIGMRAAELAATGDALIAARAVDLREAAVEVLVELGVPVDRIPADVSGAVVLADDLGPGQISEVADRGAAGVVLTGGSAGAHATIVARGLGLPMVIGAGPAAAHIADRTTVVLDGRAGTIQIDPDPDSLQAARAQLDKDTSASARMRQAAAAPVMAPSGRIVRIGANIGTLTDARAAVANGADMIGLLRTELLAPPSDWLAEDERCAQLAEIFAAIDGRPIVVRVLDIGGDKPGGSADFLGLRGLRYLLADRPLLHAQLRAILRAGGQTDSEVSLLAPMVTIPDEVRHFRAAVAQAADSLATDGLAGNRPVRIGIMVEVPAAALRVSDFAGLADFISIGSNDLLGYLMAANRAEPAVAELLDPGSPAIWRLLEILVTDAASARIKVAVCGEMAGMTAYLPQLLDLGVTELSMAPARIPVIKELVREMSTGSGEQR